MKIFLDDLADTDRKDWVPEGWTTAKTSKEFKELVQAAKEKGNNVEAISFDNDLGEEIEGFQLLQWLRDFWPEVVVGETEIKIHSANSVRREWMENFIEFSRKHRDEILEMQERPSYEELFREKLK